VEELAWSRHTRSMLVSCLVYSSTPDMFFLSSCFPAFYWLFAWHILKPWQWSTLKNGIFWDVTPYGSSKIWHSSEMSVLARVTQCDIPEDGILHSNHHENIKSYTGAAHSPKTFAKFYPDTRPDVPECSLVTLLIWFDLIYFITVDHCTWYRTSQDKLNNNNIHIWFNEDGIHYVQISGLAAGIAQSV
jgi:hypothetical protein